MRGVPLFRVIVRNVFGIALMMTALTLHPNVSAASSDAVLDAKRKAAAQLLRDGKAADCLTLLTEVIAADDTLYSDHLLMAHANEKLGHAADALPHYRRVMDLLPPASTNREERAAYQEAEKKVKQGDPLSGKLDLVAEEYQKKLDALEREALAARNMAALERIFRMRGLAWTADKVKGRGFAEVFANTTWQPTDIQLKEKQAYRIRAAGSWRIQADSAKDPQIECTANGTNQRKNNEPPFTMGQLTGRVGGKLFPLGEDVTFISPGTGPLLLIEFDVIDSYRTHNKGSLQVLITPQ